MNHRRTKIIVPLLALFLIVSGTAYGQVVGNPTGLGLLRVGPVATGPLGLFPAWYMDTNGTALEACIDGSAFCLGSTIADIQPLGVGEAFYFMATADIPVAPAGPLRFFEVALEMAFFNGDPAVTTDAQVFNRRRIRLFELPLGGDYTITHPFGEVVITAVADGNGTFEINDTIDFGGDFTGVTSFATAAQSPHIGPFLIAANAPPGYLGTGTPSTVTGSPTGTNSVTVSGPGFNSSTDQMAVIGKLATNGGIAGVRAKFARDAAGVRTVTVRAQSIGGQNLGARIGPPPVPKAKFRPVLQPVPGQIGAYSATATFAGPNAVLTPVRVKNRTDLSKPFIDVPLTDTVTITSATFANGRLSVTATSSDQLAPGPTLTLTAADTGLQLGRAKVGSSVTFNPAMPSPPTRVIVTSSNGGKKGATVVLQ